MLIAFWLSDNDTLLNYYVNLPDFLVILTKQISCRLRKPFVNISKIFHLNSVTKETSNYNQILLTKSN